MIIGRKLIFSGILFIIALVAGFLLLLRGCLSRYDVRKVLPRVAYFENNGKPLVFSVVQFEKTNAYSQKGGITTRHISTTYYVQSNDVATGEVVAEKKMRRHQDIKNHPVEIIGNTEKYAWVFMGELMAFEPNTLEIVASHEKLAELNPSLKNKLPSERRYFEFDRSDGNIKITARDGTNWILNTKDLKMTPVDDFKSIRDNSGNTIDELLVINRRQQDSLYEEKMRKPSQQLASGQISSVAYNQATKKFHEERNLLYRIRDSLQNLKRRTSTLQRNVEEARRRIDNLNERTNHSFSQIKLNGDTINGRWLGLYSPKEWKTLPARFSYQAINDETARRQLYTSSYFTNRYDDTEIEKKDDALHAQSSTFLDGGFLVNKQSGLPARYRDQNYLVVHKDQVGRDGLIQVSMVDSNGQAVWQYNSGLKEWGNYHVADNWLIILGADNAELSGHDCNLLITINLSNRQAKQYDFFENHVRK